jgi:hypothetical protein
MNIHWRIIPAAAILGLLICAVPMRASAATLYSFHVHGYTADAYFSTWDSPTTLTEAYVGTGEAVGGNATSYTFVQTDQVDFTDPNNPVLLSEDFGEVPASALQVNSKLASGSLSGSIPVTDINNNPATIWVNLSWTAAGPAAKGTSNSHYSYGGFSISTHNSGTMVPAVATGTVTDGTADFTGGNPSQFADLNKVTSGETDVTQGK